MQQRLLRHLQCFFEREAITVAVMFGFCCRAPSWLVVGSRNQVRVRTVPAQSRSPPAQRTQESATLIGNSPLWRSRGCVRWCGRRANRGLSYCNAAITHLVVVVAAAMMRQSCSHKFVSLATSKTGCSACPFRQTHVG